MKYEIPAMLKAGAGSIVNNASVAAMIGMPGISVYGASKHAVLGLTKTAAIELAQQGIRVNCISPAGVKTEMYARFTGGTEKGQEMIDKSHPIGRSGSPFEIASAVLFLCSEGAGFMTGSNMILDGGMTAQ